MNNKHLPRIFLLWLAFMMDSVLSFFLPFDFTKSSPMLISCMGLMMFTLINNELKDEEYLPYAVIAGGYYSICRFFVYLHSNLLCYCLFWAQIYEIFFLFFHRIIYFYFFDNNLSGGCDIYNDDHITGNQTGRIEISDFTIIADSNIKFDPVCFRVLWL